MSKFSFQCHYPYRLKIDCWKLSWYLIRQFFLSQVYLINTFAHCFFYQIDLFYCRIDCRSRLLLVFLALQKIFSKFWWILRLFHFQSAQYGLPWWFCVQISGLKSSFSCHFLFCKSVFQPNQFWLLEMISEQPRNWFCH